MTEPETPLLHSYQGVVCDLDGVVYRGREPVPHAVEALRAAVESGRRVVYATNNASRTPAQVAAQLTRLGVSLTEADVVTSAQAGAARVRDRVGDGARVLAVGGEGVRAALREEGLVAVSEAAGAVAVLQGFGTDVGWRELAEAAYAVQSGAVWVATNVDATLPTDRGTAPGNGTLVAAVRSATGADPDVVGKPWTPLYELSARRLDIDASQTLAVGDRLDTDIAGANAAGVDALVVLTGVHGPADLAAAGVESRPRYVAADLRCLGVGYVAPRKVDGAWACGAAAVTMAAADGPDIQVVCDGPAEHLLRASLAASWEAVDNGALAAESLREARMGQWWTLMAERLAAEDGAPGSPRSSLGDARETGDGGAVREGAARSDAGRGGGSAD
ncbi:HAD-IIA family hydrolase [Oryzihumus sp.]|uniref:HAD-IIA family hydrolase n=1 Tax=Oryzihumus sp. TaxID=1968903 RepID=UPI002EDB0B7A